MSMRRLVSRAESGTRRRASATVDAKSTWKPKRERKRRPRTKRQKGIGFGYELGMLAQGANLVDVMRSAFGNSDAGRAWQVAMRALLEPLPTLHSRRRVLGYFLRWFSAAVMHGSQWRVVDEDGFPGKQHELRADVEHVFDHETGELVERDGEIKRRHVPTRRAGGLAAHEKKSVRQQNRYRRHLRGADRTTPRGESTARGLVACEQPPYDKEDAVVPHAEGSTWAYGQAWLLLPPSAEMVERWRPEVAAAEVLAGRARVRAYGLPGELDGLEDVLAELREEDGAR